MLATGAIGGVVGGARCAGNNRATGEMIGTSLGMGAGGLAAFLVNYLSDPAKLADDLGKFTLKLVNQALAQAESLLRAMGLGLLADAVKSARQLFQELQQWVESVFGRGGTMMIGLYVVYVVVYRFFLRR